MLPTPPARVLEIGCGLGVVRAAARDALRLHRAGARPDGVRGGARACRRPRARAGRARGGAPARGLRSRLRLRGARAHRGRRRRAPRVAGAAAGRRIAPRERARRPHQVRPDGRQGGSFSPLRRGRPPQRPRRRRDTPTSPCGPTAFPWATPSSGGGTSTRAAVRARRAWQSARLRAGRWLQPPSGPASACGRSPGRGASRSVHSPDAARAWSPGRPLGSRRPPQGRRWMRSRSPKPDVERPFAGELVLVLRPEDVEAGLALDPAVVRVRRRGPVRVDPRPTVLHRVAGRRPPVLAAPVLRAVGPVPDREADDRAGGEGDDGARAPPAAKVVDADADEERERGRRDEQVAVDEDVGNGCRQHAEGERGERPGGEEQPLPLHEGEGDEGENEADAERARQLDQRMRDRAERRVDVPDEGAALGVARGHAEQEQRREEHGCDAGGDHPRPRPSASAPRRGAQRPSGRPRAAGSARRERGRRCTGATSESMSLVRIRRKHAVETIASSITNV